VCGLISFLVNTLLERDYRKKVIEQNLLYHYFGIAPLLCALILLLNFHFRAPSIIESYKVQNYDLELNSYTAGTDIVLEGNAYDRFNYVLDFDAFSASELSHAQSINLETAKGIFGYKVLLNRSVVVNPELY